MPEMPEVYTVKEQLKKIFINQTIKSFSILDSCFAKNFDYLKANELLKNEKILDIRNKGKYIFFILTNEKVLISHLGMTGKYYYNFTPLKHNWAIFTFANNDQLIYNDYRKFGTFHFSNLNDLNKLKVINKLGIEPKNVDLNSIDFLYQKMLKIKKPIKTLLLDQSFLLGIGNIYADETLFVCGIHPLTPANFLSKDQLKEIILNSRNIMNNSILQGGSSVNSYGSLNNKQGNYQNFLKMYNKQNLPCSRCNTIILKIFVNGRSSCFCPKCQKEKKYE